VVLLDSLVVFIDRSLGVGGGGPNRSVVVLNDSVVVLDRSLGLGVGGPSCSPDVTADLGGICGKSGGRRSGDETPGDRRATRDRHGTTPGAAYVHY